MNIANNLCFSICLAHFLNPELPESELERRAEVIQNDAGFAKQHMIGLHDIKKFESLIDIKIVVFYRTNGGGRLRIRESLIQKPYFSIYTTNTFIRFLI